MRSWRLCDEEEEIAHFVDRPVSPGLVKSGG